MLEGTLAVTELKNRLKAENAAKLAAQAEEDARYLTRLKAMDVEQSEREALARNAGRYPKPEAWIHCRPFAIEDGERR